MKRRTHLSCVAALLLALPAELPAQQAETAQPLADTGWICGGVIDESGAFATEAEVTLVPRVEAGAPEPEPVASASTDERGLFCLRDLEPGFYRVRVAKAGWPLQESHEAEVRAGLMNRLRPIEIELEPGEPRVSFGESFDGMAPGQQRSVLERYLMAGDKKDLDELMRRLLPKRGVRLDLSRLALGVDTKPLVDRLISTVEGPGLPPFKTARYVYLIGELSDQRTLDNAVFLLLGKLRDGRQLPEQVAVPFGAFGGRSYVSDVAVHALERLAGENFKWKKGKPPIQNRSAIQSAVLWWARELDRRARDRR